MDLIEVMEKVFLENKTRKNSRNSGIPPSHDIGSQNDRNDKNRKNSNSIGNQLDNSQTEETRQTLSPQECSSCGKEFTSTSVTDQEERRLIDIEYVIKKKTYTVETKTCSICGEKTKADFPEGVDGPEQYGVGIKASIINFLMIQMISLQRVQEHLKGLIGRNISQAIMLKYIVLLGNSLKNWENRVKKELLNTSVLYVDETSMRVMKKNYWIHTCSSGDIVLQSIHSSRGVDGIKDMGILDKYGGVVVHDCWPPYFSFENLTHALCNGHLLRELNFIEDSTGDRWASRLKRLLKTAIEMVNSRKEKVLNEKEYSKLNKLYEEILIEALVELPLFLETPGKRGRPKHTEAQNLWFRLYEYREAVLMFAKMAEIDPTNNRSERDLRMTKVKKKVSGCFRTFEIAQHFCRIYSYVKTMRNKGHSSLKAENDCFSPSTSSSQSPDSSRPKITLV